MAIPLAVRQKLKAESLTGPNAPRAVVTFLDPVPNLTLEATRVQISFIAAALGQRAVISWPNVNPSDPTDEGYYSPDRGDDDPGQRNEWYQVLFPGARVKVEMGYGDELVQVFLGQIDEVDLSVNPEDIDQTTVTIDCRDLGSKLLDQTIDDGAGNNELTYSAVPIEDVVYDVLVKAGFAPADISVEATGISITSKTFSDVTYAEVIEWCIDRTGFELVIRQDGTVSWHYPTDRQPAATNLKFTLSGTTPVNITGTVDADATDDDGVTCGTAPIVSGSEVVTSLDGSTVYQRDVDYTITQGSQTTAATLARVAGGAIPDGAQVLVDYVYAAWVWRAGQDLIRLGYRISRRHLYHKIRVRGAEGVLGEYVYPSAATFGVEGKIRTVEMPELETQADCQAAADQMGNDMRTRAREVRFAAIGNAHIQPGDCCQVIEPRTTVSEVYRVQNLELDFDDEGFIVAGTAYHYGYAPL